jgi:hypothetical protein
MRVLDPDLDDLRALLSGPDAPTFVLAPLSLDSWDIDTGDRLQTALIDHYHWVATVCGTPVFMRNGLDRPVAPSPQTCLKT